MLLRGWWCMELFLLCFLVLQPFGRWSIPATAATDCWYNEKRHKEFQSVSTIEPCLNCTCKKGTLLCYLRVCPELPDPPPPGCIIVYKYKACCPKLICSDSPPVGNELQSRTEPDDLPSFFEEPALRQACEYGGSLFESGSAMTSSTFCEHCFCIGGQQRCVRPKCLLQIKGCQPVYEKYSCCPVRYDCTKHKEKEAAPPTSLGNLIETTTAKPNKKKGSGGIRAGCFVSKKYYPEGTKVLGVGYSVCDNCYCVRSMVRCEPMSCAPPILGCTPVIKEGECCATSYNCNNSIEIQPNPNYAEFPEISKEYAKLRKEVPLWNKQKTTQRISGDNGLHYVIAQSADGQNWNDLNSKHVTNSAHFPKDIQHSTYKRHTSPTITSKYPNVSSNLKQFLQIHSIPYKPKPEKTLLKYALDERVIRKVDNKTKEETSTIAPSAASTLSTTENSSTNVENQTNTMDVASETQTLPFTSTVTNAFTETDLTFSDNLITTKNNDSTPVVITTIVSKSTCLETSTNSDETTTDALFITTLNSSLNQLPVPKQENVIGNMSQQDSNKTNLKTASVNTTSNYFLKKETESPLNSSASSFGLLPAISSLLGSILNDSREEEDSVDYDYSEPTLPPSLPNLRIIPFVAADALDEPNEEENTHFPQVTESPPYTLFSPPTKTEGGFVPKESLLPVENFENNFHIATTPPHSDEVSSSPVTESLNKLNYSCQVKSTLFEHGQTVPGKDSCTICTCLYGKVACHEPECPPPEIYCQEPSATEILSCCPTHYCGDSPGDPMDRMDTFIEQSSNNNNNSSSSNSKIIINGGVSDRQQVPFLNLNLSHSSVPQQQQQQQQQPSRSSSEQKSSLQHQLQALNSNSDRKHLNNKINEMAVDTNQNTGSSQLRSTGCGNNFNKSAMTNHETAQGDEDGGGVASANSSLVPIADSGDDNRNSIDGTVGVLKLAGCNIYGRMYRVGKIIVELSGPCLQCRCTDVGVQCKSNKC